MNNSPFFSVMICCYNSEKYIVETLNSIINQTFKDWEIVIVDDGSTDKTVSIINDYINKGTRINYFFQENKGLATARNKAVELAESDWIVIIDHDDICMLNRLEEQYSDIVNNPDVKLFFSNSYHIDEYGKVLNEHFKIINPIIENLSKHNAMNSLLKKGCYIDSETVVFNKNAAIDIGLFNENYKFILDYDFFLKMGKNYNLYCNKNILSKWRVHNEQATNKMYLISLDEFLNIYWIYMFNSEINLNVKFILLLRYIKVFIKRLIIRAN